MSGTLMQPETSVQSPSPAFHEAGYQQPYRALSVLAVCSALLGVLSVLGLAAPVLIAVAVLGVVLGVLALRGIARYPDELSGRGVAWFGLVCSLTLGVAATLLHVYTFYTEVPEGFERVYFKQLQNDQPDEGPPAAALELNQKPIFIKGYMHPDAGMAPVSEFVLVPDMGTCCFGGQPELTDMIQVVLPPEAKVRYSTRKMKLAGVLEVDPELTPLKGYIGVYYKLNVTHVQ